MSVDHSEFEKQIREVLGTVQDPETGRPLRKQIRQVEVSDQQADVSVGLTSHCWPLRDDFQSTVETVLKNKFGTDKPINVAVEIQERPAQAVGQVGITAKSIIAVAAGKGGVGKSTVATSLAQALKKAGCKTGLLDADVYGPSIPHLTGARGQVVKGDNNKIQPMIVDGIPVMSIGFMVPPGEAVIWRGPMLHSAITTFLRDTDWGDLDHLIIDMPPGTGDIALSLSQMLPLTGAVIVCTPQEVALIDAVKAVGMFRKVKIPVLGLIENMSSFVCPDNGKEYDIFGKGGAEQYAKEDKIDFLGSVPISIDLRKRGDAGEMLKNFDDPNVAPYLETIAKNLCRTLADRVKENPIQAQLPVLG